MIIKGLYINAVFSIAKGRYNSAPTYFNDTVFIVLEGKN